MQPINVNRRKFMAGSAIAVGTAISATPSLAAPVPVLHGDGVHDDTDALEHLFSGGTVVLFSQRMTARNDGRSVQLLNATFQTRRALRRPDHLNVYSANCSFIVAGGPSLPYPLFEG